MTEFYSRLPEELWMEYFDYDDKVCGLCRNTGLIYLEHRLGSSPCICPNGRIESQLRKKGNEQETTQESGDRRSGPLPTGADRLQPGEAESASAVRRNESVESPKEGTNRRSIIEEEGEIRVTITIKMNRGSS